MTKVMGQKKGLCGKKMKKTNEEMTMDEYRNRDDGGDDDDITDDVA